jgi:hypothetical protein
MIGHSPTYLLFFRDARKLGAPLTPYEWAGESLADCVAELAQCDAAEEVWRFDPDVAPEDVSVEAACAWWRRLRETFDPQTDCVPAFLEKHLPDIDDALEGLTHRRACEAADRSARTSPHAMGRV